MATLYKRGSAWYINYSQNGAQHRESLGTVSKQAAEREKRRIEYEIGEGLMRAPPSPMFSAYAKDYALWFEQEYPASYDPAKYVIQSLVDHFGHLSLDQIKVTEVNAWKSRRSGEIGPETITKHLRTLKAMLNRAVEWELIEAHPCAKARAPKSVVSKPPRYYTRDEMQAIYRCAPDRFVWQLMVNTGLRRSEALHLRREHVSDDAVMVLSEAGARTKSAKWRRVPLSPAAQEAIDRLPAREDGYLLDHIHPSSLTRAFMRAARRSGVGGHLHCLRHTFCSHLVMSGVDLRTVQILAGHSTITVTEKYAHLSPDHLRNATAGLRL